MSALSFHSANFQVMISPPFIMVKMKFQQAFLSWRGHRGAHAYKQKRSVLYGNLIKVTWTKLNADRTYSVKIKFSRHAKRRANLYQIPESTILKILEGRELSPGTHQIIQRVEGFQYPLKVILAVQGDVITIITNYPLKKGLET